jgi:hypothetical protein
MASTRIETARAVIPIRPGSRKEENFPILHGPGGPNVRSNVTDMYVAMGGDAMEGISP